MNFNDKWENLIQHEDKILFRAKEHEGSETYSAFRISTFLKRARRFSNAFKSELGLEEGDRVALFLDYGSTFTLSLHGLWLAGLVAVPLDVTLDDSIVTSMCNNCEVKAVIFSPASAAKVASVYPKVPSVEHWLVAGGSRSLGPEKLTRTLDETIASTNEDSVFDTGSNDLEALVVLASGKDSQFHGVMFTQSQLLAAAESQKSMYQAGSEEKEKFWCTLPPDNICSIVASQIAPLFCDSEAFMGPEFEAREFWSMIKQTGVTYVMLNHEQLKVLYKKAKGRDWLKPERLFIYLVADDIIDPELVRSFERRFNMKLYPCHSCTEAGGIVSAFPLELTTQQRKKLIYEIELVSSGIQLPGVSISISHEMQGEESAGMPGKILLKSKQNMSSYYGTEPGEAYVTQGDYLNTEDEGFFIDDDNGKAHLVVVSRVSARES